MSENERTLALIKPDGVAKGHVGEILSRIERKGLRIVAMDLRLIDEATANQHYAEHVGKDFYPPLLDFITSGPSVALVLEGIDAIAHWRLMMGKTNPTEAAPGSIRGDFALFTRENLTHGSDSPESAAREIGIFFPEL